MKHLSLLPRATLLYSLAAAAEDRALRGRNLSAACGGYTAGQVALRQPDWPVHAGILPSEKSISLSDQNHTNHLNANTSHRLSTISGKLQFSRVLTG